MTNNQMLLKEIINQEFKGQTDILVENDFFEFFSAVQILKDYGLSDEELLNGITGCGNDGGCDSMYLFLNNEILTQDQLPNLKCSKGSQLELVIIQSKNTMRFGEDALMKWKAVSENLLSMSSNIDDFKKRYNEGVRDMFQLFRGALTKLITLQPKIHIQYYYVTLGVDLHPNVVSQANDLKTTVKKMYPSARVEVGFVDADKLIELYNREADEEVTINIADQPITLGQANEFVTLVNLVEYFRFIADSEGKIKKGIFDSNVRDYQGTNAVNSSIADSLLNKKMEDFWWLNNGITVLSEKITLVTSKTLSILNPEIVNGLQTSTEIFRFFSDNKEEMKNETRNILVRFIVPESEEVRDDIIFATNNQTNIPKSSLRVTDSIHLQIEMYFKTRGLYYDRRKNYYKNQKKKASEIIGVSFLAQCLITLLLRKPDFARARPSTLLTDDNTYEDLYQKNGDLEVYYKVALLGKKVRQNLRSASEMTTSEKSDILFYLLYGVVSKILNTTSITREKILKLDVNVITDRLITEARTAIYEKYKELGGNGRVAKSSNFIDVIDELQGLSGV